MDSANYHYSFGIDSIIMSMFVNRVCFDALWCIRFSTKLEFECCRKCWRWLNHRRNVVNGGMDGDDISMKAESWLQKAVKVKWDHKIAFAKMLSVLCIYKVNMLQSTSNTPYFRWNKIFMKILWFAGSFFMVYGILGFLCSFSFSIHSVHVLFGFECNQDSCSNSVKLIIFQKS